MGKTNDKKGRGEKMAGNKNNADSSDDKDYKAVRRAFKRHVLRDEMQDSKSTWCQLLVADGRQATGELRFVSMGDRHMAFNKAANAAIAAVLQSTAEHIKS